MHAVFLLVCRYFGSYGTCKIYFGAYSEVFTHIKQTSSKPFILGFALSVRRHTVSTNLRFHDLVELCGRTTWCGNAIKRRIALIEESSSWRNDAAIN